MEEQLNSFVKEAKEMAIQLAETPYGAEASALVIGIEEKVQGILKRQEETLNLSEGANVLAETSENHVEQRSEAPPEEQVNEKDEWD